MPKAVIDGASVIIPAMARRASSDSLPPAIMQLRPSFIMRMCTCMPEPALPTVIFGANVTSRPYS